MTARFNDRIKNYSRLNCKDQRVLYNSLLSHGFGNHKIEVIDHFESTRSYANGKEIMWIRSYMSNLTKWRDFNGMNLTNGGDGASWTATPELSKKLSELRKGRKLSAQTKINISNSLKGKIPHNKGKKMSETQRLHLSKIKKGIAPAHRVGVPLSEDAKRRISETKKGKISSLKGIKKTEDIRIKIAQAHFTKNIFQYSLLGEFICKYKSIKEASEILKISPDTISDIANGVTKKPKRFIFKFK